MTYQSDLTTRLELDQDAAVTRVSAALAEEGFGVLTRIDLHAAFAEKLGRSFRPYSILGACNPELAYRAVSARPDVGLLLPCNVTIESDSAGGSLVRIVDPTLMMGIGDLSSNADVAAVAADAGQRLRRVVASLGQ